MGVWMASSTTWHLTCDGGLIDLVFRPAAFEGGYESLRPDAVSFSVFGFPISVAALDQIIASKRAVDRPSSSGFVSELHRMTPAVTPDSCQWLARVTCDLSPQA